MNYKIDSLIPVYPSIKNENFARLIFKKEEFYSNRTPVTAIPLEKGSGDKYPQQQFLANFLSPFTPYNKMIVYHAMGQGKTCASIAISEVNKNRLYSKPTLVLVRGGSGVQIFKKAIVNDCNKPGIYKPDSIKQYYEINTLQKFANNVSFPRDFDVYSDRVIIIDEAHNVRLNPEEGKDKKKEDLDAARVEFAKIYNTIHRLLQNVKNTKIILLTGTPMRDKTHEIGSLMNLILPADKQLPTEKNFDERYIDRGGKSLINKEELQSHFVGTVSYLQRNNNPSLEIIEMGVGGTVFTEFNVYPSMMQDLQYNAYLDAYKNDSGDTDLKKISYSAFQGKVNQSVLCVTPSGGYGSSDYSQIMKINKISGASSLVGNVLEKFLNEGGDGTDEKRLEQLGKISCKYATIIRTILGKNKDVKSIHPVGSEMKELVFVFNNLVQQSGGILFGLILSLFGFSHVKVNRRGRLGSEGGGGGSFKNNFILSNHTPYKSFAIINKLSTQSDAKVSAIIDAHNHPDNVGGKYIRVIVGSEVISEGIDLNNISQIHIATPHWNNSETEQAIARGIRIGKHRELLKLGIEPKIRIFRHLAVRRGKDAILTIDYKKYQLSTRKGKLVNQVTTLMRNASVDCNLNKARNGGGGEKCLGYDIRDDPLYTGDIENPLRLQDLNKDTGIFFYSMDDPKSRMLVSIIRELFRYKFRYYRIVLIDYINKMNSGYTYTTNYITFTLKELIDRLEPIQNPYSKVSYIKENANTYYLANDISSDVVPPDSIYYIYNSFDNTRLSDIKYTEQFLDKYINTEEDGDLSLFENVELVDTIAISKQLLKLYEQDKDTGLDNDNERNILDTYKPLFIEIDGRDLFILPYLMKKGIVFYRLPNGDWVENDNELVGLVDRYVRERGVELQDSSNYYALITVDKNKPDFKLAINTDFMTGKVNIKDKFQKKKCITTSSSNILNVFMDIDGISIDTYTSKSVTFSDGSAFALEKDFKKPKDIIPIIGNRTKMTNILISSNVKKFYPPLDTKDKLDALDINKFNKLFFGFFFKNSELICRVVRNYLYSRGIVSFAVSSKSSRRKDAPSTKIK